MKLVSIHIYKCAGTTLKFMFKERYDVLIDNENAEPFYEHWKTGKFGEFPRYDLSCYEMIHGHFPYEKYKDIDAPFITFLRHPVDRVISQYMYNVECHTPLGDSQLGNNIIDYAKNTANTMSTFIGERDNIDFIGVTEMFDDCIEMINYLYDMNLDTGRVENARQSVIRFDASKEVRAEIAAINDKDMKLYNEVMSELHHGS